MKCFEKLVWSHITSCLPQKMPLPPFWHTWNSEGAMHSWSWPSTQSFCANWQESWRARCSEKSSYQRNPSYLLSAKSCYQTLTETFIVLLQVYITCKSTGYICIYAGLSWAFGASPMLQAAGRQACWGAHMGRLRLIDVSCNTSLFLKFRFWN